MIDKLSAILALNSWLLMALIPVMFSALVFAWILFLMRGRSMTTLQIRGLGLSLRVDTVQRDTAPEN